MSKILGIDYGTKKIGVAISDKMHTISHSIGTYSEKEFFQFLSKLIENEEINCIVIGYPKNLDGSLAEITNKINLFISKIENRLSSVNIVKFDERFTSKIAQRTINQSGIKKKKRRNKKLIDMISASIILQDYLNNL